MQPAGDNVLAQWREAGRWWQCEPYLEKLKYVDSKGILRESVLKRPSIGDLHVIPTKDDQDQSEEWSLKVRKTRDEKVAKACGQIPEEAPPPTYKKVDHPYAALHVLSGYAFGRGTMLAPEIPAFASHRGAKAVLLADPFSLAGVVEFCHTAYSSEVKPLIGSCIEMEEGGEIVLVAKTARGYKNLSQLITACHLEEPRGFPLCNWERLERFSEDLICLSGGDRGPLNHLLTQGRLAEAELILSKLVELFGKQHTFLQIERNYLPWEFKANALLKELGSRLGVRLVAGGEITHSLPEHFPAQDMLTCIETLCLAEEIVGRKALRELCQPQIKPKPRRALNAERYLKGWDEVYSSYCDAPELVENSLIVADLCDENVLPKRTTLPKLYDDPNTFLRELTKEQALRYHRKVTPALTERLDNELDTIIGRGFAEHFLVAWEACNWAREQDIQMSGRGSVVDSAVAFCLGLSRIDAFKHNLHFDRFLPSDGDKRPDIDIDFEAHRREEVRQHLRRKYGDAHVATVAAIGSYRTRGIVREIGKVLELPLETVNFLCKRIHGGVSAHKLESALEKRPELRNSNIPKERFQWVFKLAEMMMDIPRGMRAHSSGVVISRDPIAETVPVMWSGADDVKIIQWDKRSAKHYFDKFDILCLRGQDVLAGTEKLVRGADPAFRIENVPADDPNNFRTMQAGATIGIPQSASPAMRQAHQRLKTENLKDVSLVQAGIRPGVGGAVKLNELIARRRYGKKDEHSGLHFRLDEILKDTYGLIVFQEQVDQLLQDFAGYSSSKSEDMREKIHEKRHERFAESVREEVFNDIFLKTKSKKLADHIFDLVAGFEGYGFAQGHALAFADISLRSVYCQTNFPSEYFAALLNAQPAGYYGPHTIANEARLRGVTMLRPNVNLSEEGHSVADGFCLGMSAPRSGIRIGLKQLEGLSKTTLERLLLAREKEQFESLFDLVVRVKPNRDELENLILCGALDSLHPNRRALLWAVPKAIDFAETQKDLGQNALPLIMPEPPINFKGEDFTVGEKAVYERVLLGLDIDRHIMTFERERVKSKGGLTGSEATSFPHGTKSFVVGNPIRLRFPPTSSGRRVMFFDLEDESGLLNVTCFDETYQRYGHAVICNTYITLFGEVQDRDGHKAFMADKILPYTPVLDSSLSDEVVRVGDFLVS